MDRLASPDITVGPVRSPWLARLAVFAAVAAAFWGLVAGLAPAPGPLDRLRDDAYYEYAWVANLVAGRGPTVSDGTPTSGVQVLWCLCLTPFAWWFGPAALPVVAPWLGFAMHAAAALAWLRTAGDRVAVLGATLCWLGNPLLVRECQNGQETALACLVLTLLWAAREGPQRRFLLLGGLACLARTDLLAVVAALALAREGPRWRALIAPAFGFAAIVAAACACGSGPLPDSGAPMAWLWHANFAATEPGLGAWCGRAWWYLRPVLLGGPFALASAMGIGIAVFSIVRPVWPRALRAVPAVVVGGAGAAGLRDLIVPAWIALLLALRPAARAHRVPRDLLALFVGTAAIVALHWAVRWYPRDYYAAPLVVTATAALLRAGHVRVLLLAFAVAQLVDGRNVPPEPLRGQQELEMGGRFLADVLPRGERVGSFNCGLVAFHGSVLPAGTDRARAVVNLDGVVDHRAFAALRERRLSAWLDEQGVCFLLDNPVQFSADLALPHACGRWFGPDFVAQRDLAEIARFDVPGVDNGRPGGDSLRLYWRRGRGTPPAAPGPARDLGPGPGPGAGRYVLWPAHAGDWLEVEQSPGLHRPLVHVDADTAVVLFVPGDAIGTGRLFVRGSSVPALVLPRL